MYTHFSNTTSWSRLDGGWCMQMISCVYKRVIVSTDEAGKCGERCFWCGQEIVALPTTTSSFLQVSQQLFTFRLHIRLKNCLLWIWLHAQHTDLQSRADREHAVQVKTDRDISRAEPMCAPYLGQLDIRPIITTPKLFLFTIKHLQWQIWGGQISGW